MNKRKISVTAMVVLSVLAGTLVAVSAGGVSGYNVIWDNGMNYDVLRLTQNNSNPIGPFYIIVADDFIFTENQTVRDVHWIGGYDSEDGNFDWEIIFYEDAGSGTKPGAVIASFYFNNTETHETYVGTGLDVYLCYDYSVDLPTPIEFAANTKYWISVQGIGYYEPDSYWAAHMFNPILLHEAVYKSSLGIPDWTNFTESSDMCFQLTSGNAEVPALTPLGIIALASLLSAIAAVAIVRKKR